MLDLIINWCEAHNITLARSTLGVQATAYGNTGEPIDTVVITHRVEELPEPEDDTHRAMMACDTIAERLLILKPSVAHVLNASHHEYP